MACRSFTTNQAVEFRLATPADFSPDLLTIQEQAPAQLPRTLALSVAGLCGLMVAWACFARLDVIAVAEGRLVPVSFTKVVQPAEAGVVEQIFVKEGDRVVAGQTLMKLDARLSGIDVSGLDTDVVLKDLSLARIEAELVGGAIKYPANTAKALVAKVDAQFSARKSAYHDAVAQETAALSRSKSDLEAASQIRSKLQATVPILKQAADSYETLRKEGYVGDILSNEKKREYMERERDLRSQESTVESLKAAVAQSEAKLVSIRSNYRSQLETERMDLLSSVNKSRSELDKSKVRSGLLEIKAPNDGLVKDLAVTTKGAVVSAGALLMNIVPQNEALQAEVLLRNEDVGFVVPGQVTRLKVAAYPFQRYGLIEGKVALVSADSADPAKQNQLPGQPPQLTYRALVKLDSNFLKSEATNESLRLSTGMLVSAEIHQRQRTVMEYLISPIQKVTQEAARER
jgi:hemolysin D